MRRTQKLSCSLGLLTLSFVTSAFAIPSLPCGVYIDGNYGVTRMYGKTYPANTSNTASGKGWSADLGYKFTPYWGVEAGYTRYMDTRIQNTSGITAARDRHYGIDVAAKGTFPLGTSGAEVFGKAGVAWLHSQIGDINPTAAAVNNLSFNTGSQSSTGLYWGGGVQYYFSENFSGNIQYAQAQGNSKTGTLGVATAGLSVLF